VCWPCPFCTGRWKVGGRWLLHGLVHSCNSCNISILPQQHLLPPLSANSFGFLLLLQMPLPLPLPSSLPRSSWWVLVYCGFPFPWPPIQTSSWQPARAVAKSKRTWFRWIPFVYQHSQTTFFFCIPFALASASKPSRNPIDCITNRKGI